MNQEDFIKLHGLLAKLDIAANQAVNVDNTFKKYNTNSIEVLKQLPVHLRQIEQGLKIARITSSTY